MLVLGFVLQPVMVAYGQLHEILAHVGDGVAHVEGDVHDGEPASPDDDERDHEPDVVHALSHHAHCCAQPQSLPPSSLAALPPALDGTRPPGVDPDAAPDSRFDTPFRPPIVA